MSRRKPSAAIGNAIIVEPANSMRDAGTGTDDGGGSTEPASIADDGTGIDPSAVASASASGDSNFPERKRRGRPPGGTNKAKPVPSGISGIEKTLYGIHQMLGAIVAPELALDTDDAHRMADAISAVNKHYNVSMFDAKTQDWLNLILVAGAIYGARGVAIRDRVRTSRAPRIVVPRAQSANPIPGNPAPSGSEMNGAAKAELRALNTGEVPGLGTIEFPADHPLSPLNRRH